MVAYSDTVDTTLLNAKPIQHLSHVSLVACIGVKLPFASCCPVADTAQIWLLKCCNQTLFGACVLFC